MNILWLDENSCQDVKIAGGKAAALGRLAARYPVPPGFCVSGKDFEDSSIAKAYGKLGEKCRTTNPAVAVRSSATDEDGASASFAGQYETYLNIVGADEVLTAVKRCFESARSDRVAAYRSAHDKKDDNPDIAVLVQQLITADISAVVFSVNPVSGNKNEIIINSNRGLGESIVSGTVTPDTYVISKPELEIKEARAAGKTVMTIAAPEKTGVIEVPVPRVMADHLSMTDKQAVKTAELALKLEKESGFAVDIECGWKDEKLFLFQCRPAAT